MFIMERYLNIVLYDKLKNVFGWYFKDFIGLWSYCVVIMFLKL